MKAACVSTGWKIAASSWFHWKSRKFSWNAVRIFPPPWTFYWRIDWSTKIELETGKPRFVGRNPRFPERFFSSVATTAFSCLVFLSHSRPLARAPGILVLFFLLVSPFVPVPSLFPLVLFFITWRLALCCLYTSFPAIYFIFMREWIAVPTCFFRLRYSANRPFFTWTFSRSVYVSVQICSKLSHSKKTSLMSVWNGIAALIIRKGRHAFFIQNKKLRLLVFLFTLHIFHVLATSSDNCLSKHDDCVEKKGIRFF